MPKNSTSRTVVPESITELRRKSATYFTDEARQYKEGGNSARLDRKRLYEGGMFIVMAINAYGVPDYKSAVENLHYVADRMLEIAKDKNVTRVQKEGLRLVANLMSGTVAKDTCFIFPWYANPQYRPKTILWMLNVIIRESVLLAQSRGSRLPTITNLIENTNVCYMTDPNAGRERTCS